MNIDCSDGYICDGNLAFCRMKSNNTDYTYCAKEGILCKEGEGGCNSDSQCEGSLVCGTNNCPSGPNDLDCCSGKENRTFLALQKNELVHLAQTSSDIPLLFTISLPLT